MMPSVLCKSFLRPTMRRSMYSCVIPSLAGPSLHRLSLSAGMLRPSTCRLSTSSGVGGNTTAPPNVVDHPSLSASEFLDSPSPSTGVKTSGLTASGAEADAEVSRPAWLGGAMIKPHEQFKMPSTEELITSSSAFPIGGEGAADGGAGVAGSNLPQDNIVSHFKSFRPKGLTQEAGRKGLGDICPVAELERLNPKAIRIAWNGRHAFQLQKHGRVISGAMYRALAPRLQKHPFFVFPILRSKLGLFLVVTNNVQDLTLVAPLADWQKMGGSATAHLTIQFFTELMDSKDLVLVRTEIKDMVTADSPHQTLLREDAVWITDCLLRYYTFPNYFEQYTEPFNRSPATFDFHRYLRQAMADARGRIDFPQVTIEDRIVRYDPTKM
eukprot:TRINITY_DN32717_c0_g1_i1.p1 TRINITY_DN32717_c0_g1~~TRINITY_DN32717_c0_g1_i1.p1  ORF type:complete len:382 (-),score=62.91 TRINITY_DN32717_c0_g1_i1:102-1247(-)